MPRLLEREGACLVVIDVQERLFTHVADGESVLKQILKLVRFSKLIGIPIVLTEQYPKGLGPTLKVVKEEVAGDAIVKTTFNCFGSEEFVKRLEEIGAKTLILSGIETHICVAQTALDAIDRGYRVCVISDATSSRSLKDKEVGIERMRSEGITISSTEMLIYELLKDSSTDEFKQALRLIKGIP